MKLISCDNCAVVVDGDKLVFPLSGYGDDGTIDERKAEYDQNSGSYRVYRACPNCGTPIFGDLA